MHEFCNRAALMPSRPPRVLGKYRDLMLAIGLFILLDLGVLAFNFYASGRIEIAASKINASAELRMYTQQLTKALLTLRTETRDALPVQTSMAQIAESHDGFNRSLEKLRLLADRADPIHRMFGDATDRESDLREKVANYWRPLDETLVPIRTPLSPEAIDVEIAATKAVARNIRLMQLADDLTQHLENQAVSTAARLRYIQMAAILLALVNFAFIVFKFLRALEKSDRSAAAAREETDEILATVREGLFLLQPDGRIGGQRSRSLDQLFGLRLKGGERLSEILQALVEPQAVATAMEYMALLFESRVKPSLLTQLNPLQEVAIRGKSERAAPSYLNFEFAQVREGDDVIALLVTVQDRSEQVRLRQELAGAEDQAKQGVELLLVALDQEPAMVQAFLDSAEDKLGQINSGLQGVEADAKAYSRLLDGLFRLAHALKGEAAALNFLSIVREAHEYEDRLAALRGRDDLEGKDLIPLAVATQGLREQVLRLRSVFERVEHFARRSAPVDPLTPAIHQCERLAVSVARDLNKKVRFEARLEKTSQPSDSLVRLVREALPQLIRNAVAHGIESPEERLAVGKPSEGIVRVDLEQQADGQVLLSVWDDGRGICTDTLRQHLIETGHKPKHIVDKLSDKEVIGVLFEPGFSTLPAASPHAGRGVGLDLIRDLIVRLGAKLRVATQVGAFTRFTLMLKT